MNPHPLAEWTDRRARLLAPAKVNLFLDVLDRREDGYHNLDAVNVSVDLFDELEVTVLEGAVFELSCDDPEIPTDDGNHPVRAAKLLLEGTRFGVRMRLAKRIPVGAGLGGGTSDAAASIRFLGPMLGRSEANLLDLSLSVGSDVPYSLIGGACRVKGKGERIYPLGDLSELRLVLVDPGFPCRTGELYRRLAPSRSRPHPHAEGFIEAWSSGDWEAMGKRMFNAFESVVFEDRPELAAIRDRLRVAGCLGAGLTGSGSHLVGLLAPGTSADSMRSFDGSGLRTTFVRTLPREFPGAVRIE